MPTPPDPATPTRYCATSEADTVYVWCREHVAEPLLSFPDGLDVHVDQVQEACAEHDRQFHEDDLVV